MIGDLEIQSEAFVSYPIGGVKNKSIVKFCTQGRNEQSEFIRLHATGFLGGHHVTYTS